MQNKKPWYQALTDHHIPLLLAGFLALGAILDTFSNVIDWITPTISYIASLLLIIAFILSKWLPRKLNIPWILKDDDDSEKRVYIKSTGIRITLLLLGVQFGFWLPLIVKGEDSTFTRLNEISSTFEESSTSDRPIVESANIFNNGWFSEQENRDRLNEVIKVVGDRKHDPFLDAEYRENTIQWCAESLAQLTGERGKIGGFVYDDELFKSDQEWTLQAYDATIIIVRQLLDMVGNWDKETPEIRNTRFDEIISAALDSRIAFGSLQSINPQLLTAWDEETSEIEALYEESKAHFRYLRHRQYSIVLAIAATIIFVGDIAITWTKKNTEPVFVTPKKPSKQRRNKKRNRKRRD